MCKIENRKVTYNACQKAVIFKSHEMRFKPNNKQNAFMSNAHKHMLELFNPIDFSIFDRQIVYENSFTAYRH